MRHGSLFSGGGGFDLAAEIMGWENVFHCETDSFCNRLLTYYWPKAESHADIKQFDATKYRGKIDILTGGFPCQPFSQAGERKGTEDNRYLWPEMLRVIREIRPRWVIAENVYGLLNWNDGVVFETVHTGLEAEGYEVRTFILPAAGINAPHRRYRIWFIAYTNSDGRHRKHRKNEKQTNKGRKHAQHDLKPLVHSHAYANVQRCKGRTKTKNTTHWEEILREYARLCTSGYWKRWPTEPALCGLDDGLPNYLDGITIPKWRTESIKMYGNAIVPQVVLQIFKSIQEAERLSAEASFN